MPKLHVLIGSTRPGRSALPIGQWAAKAAEEHGGFDVKLVDLARFELTLLNEAAPPRLDPYIHEHTRTWSAKVDDSVQAAFGYVQGKVSPRPVPGVAGSGPASCARRARRKSDVVHLACAWKYSGSRLKSRSRSASI